MSNPLGTNSMKPHLKMIKLKTAKYIVIPIGIETSIGSHANILFSRQLNNKLT